MTDIKETLKATEDRIAALKREIAKEELLLPGLRYAMLQANGPAVPAAKIGGGEPEVNGRLRLGDDTKIVLEMLFNKGTATIDTISTKLGDRKKAREALRNLSRRELVTKTDTDATITALGRTFMKKYEETH